MDDAFKFMETPGYSQPFFGCVGDIILSAALYCVPCLVIGQTSGQLFKNGQFDIVACCCGGISAYRIRRYTQQRFGIVEPEDSSICAVTLCGCCAAVQDIHELTVRGAIPPLLSSGSGPAPQAQPQMMVQPQPQAAPVGYAPQQPQPQYAPAPTQPQYAPAQAMPAAEYKV
ncbi:hypothetical protein HDU76_001710 [Blyttiomyces sp. JEL0837]|nr:hypothetical protein HDU76_001710 [Blyttiomyces sp. JEL0837]